jgi:hypothetical protein
MPNWCNNTVEINHKDPAKMYALVEAVNAGKFCNFVIPVPESLHIVAGRAGADDNPEQIALVEAENRNIAEHGYANWYDYQVAKWGTKWDVEPYDTVEYDDQHDKNGVTFGFDSAWSPPIGVYEALTEQGYTVRACYYEPGMAFAGIWDDGADDYYELGGLTSTEARERLPEALDDMFGISETIAEYEEEENQDIDLDGGLSAINE